MGSITEFGYILDSLTITPHASKDLMQDKNFWTGTPYKQGCFFYIVDSSRQDNSSV